MAKKDDENPEIQEQAPKETAMAKKEPVASTEGLIKMMKGDRVIHAHTSAVKEHIKNGWKHA